MYKEAAPGESMTWELLAELEPRLVWLVKYTKSIKDDKSASYFCANAVWYGYDDYAGIGLKDALIHLVGSLREKYPDDDPILETSEAYDLASEILYWSLPDCRNCHCEQETAAQKAVA